MHWLDGISLDDNLISGRASGSNGDNGDNNQRKSTQSSSPTKAKRRRHAHYKLNSRLDRKSSRGMIYENEELRLRTININAEVERGQSDIKRLRRENEHLRREIWSLRDECDRLNKRFKAKLSEHEYGGCRGSGGSGRRCSGGGRGSAGCDGNSDDSESCDTCRCDDDGHCSDECCQERGGSCVPIKQPLPPEEPKVQPVENHTSAKPDNQPMHFDHLSVVSEETLSNPEMQQAQLPPEHLMLCTPDLNSSQSTLPSLVGPLTPLTPIELVANQLNDLQATVPPLSYFENILAHHQSPHSVLTPTPELGTSSSTTTGKTMKHTNGWDYNLQSPFSQRKYSSTSSPSRSPPPVPLTTFVPTSTLQAMPKIALNVPTTNGAGGSIETVAITTNATQQALNSPKHFFAPIKPRLKLNTELANRGQDALPPDSPPPPPHQPEVAPPPRDPPDIFVNNALATPYQRPGPRLSPQTDSVNLESLLNDIQTISGDILAIQLEKSKSRDNLMGSSSDKEKSKPYRSEMNLYLQYDGTNPTISNATCSTPTATVAGSNTSDSNGSHKLSSRTRSLEREHTDSPAPHMPDPMAPFPEKCTYLGFEQVNQAVQVPQSPSGQKPPLAVKPSLPAKPPPPLPPARRPPPVSMPTEPPPPPPVSGVAPNKSHLYKSLANAAAKRAIFRSTPTQLTRSLDVECTGDEPAEPAGTAGTANEEEDAAKRKARRVSIVCGEEQPLANGGLDTAAGAAPTTTASCGDLISATSGALIHPAIKAFRQISHSTPSSPHSLRRCINSNTMTAGQAEAANTASAPPSTTHHHHHRKESSDPAPMTATVSRTKCSRRHSEGTVHSGQHRISGSSGGAAGGNGGHHHHHSHHHQHSSLISSNPHHSHHSHQDSNHETVTSQSDRNSNSFGSSRESSTSFSMRSNRRKISISSHTGGKIPWCGCWGNGCL
ncbi:PREDICTED: mucin-5AC isoform X5 [Drosophila arizonae]|uniref:Mucin-5AC isoform X5 n=1 Tax=Drosophila arizonae TaxID=7263 RepID=A0ABM1NML9_DROAR|nr:PREDICTED: mucin-5AC isoform X5 [Drosophila arizonae]